MTNNLENKSKNFLYDIFVPGSYYKIYKIITEKNTGKTFEDLKIKKLVEKGFVHTMEFSRVAIYSGLLYKIYQGLK